MVSVATGLLEDLKIRTPKSVQCHRESGNFKTIGLHAISLVKDPSPVKQSAELSPRSFQLCQQMAKMLLHQ